MGRASSRKRKRLPMSKSRKVDRISKLPDALLYHILSFLTTEEVVQTCIFSKRWRYVWTHLPFLDFDFNIFQKKKWEHETLMGDDEDKMASFTNFINQVLLRYDCSHIVTFRFDSPRTVQSCMVESWICYAVKHHVQQLDIAALCDDSIVVPCWLFSCESLTSLTLAAYCDHCIECPKALKLASLKTLRLETFSDVDGNIFSSCPNLETLILVDIYIDNLNIHALNLKILKILNPQDGDLFGCKVMIFAPKLTHFEFDGWVPLFCWTSNLTSIVEVKVDFLSWHWWPLDESDGRMQAFGLRMMNMLNEFHNAKSITLSLNALKVLSFVPAALNEHPSAFPNLKCLKLKIKEWCKAFNVPACILTYFLNGSTSLKVYS